MKIARLLVAAYLALIGIQTFAQGMQVPTPSPGLMPSPMGGQPLYARACAVCHGDELTGTDKGPPLLHKIYEPSHHSDASFQMAVKHGSRAHHWQFGNMPPVDGLSPDDVAHITAYVRMRQRRVGIQ
ncbi:MAG: cytochrome c [Zoogloeaceae bacterium]|nr:cytochrome c [Zoogloeaceae bacterium]